jgi:capsular polysaccharide biosynthesis protein
MIKETLKEVIIQRKFPINITQGDLNIFDHQLSKALPPVYIIENENVTIVQGAVVINKKNKRIDEYSGIYSYTQKKIDRVKILVKRIFFQQSAINYKCFWITDGWSTGYFHWLSDALPRLICLNNEVEKCAILLPDFYRNLEFVTSSLRLLGFSTIFFNPYRPVVVQKLSTCTYVAPTGNYNPSVLKELRQRLINEVPIEPVGVPTFDIYISRSKATRRRVLNETEVVALLTGYGFKIVFAEDLSFEEQIILFDNANNVIGIHGAGLTNCLFMKPDRNLLELRRKGDEHNNCYYSMANANDINYFYLECEADNDDTNICNLKVDLSKLKLAVESMKTNNHK